MTTAVATMRRREIHAASAKILSPNQMMMMPYRGKFGAVSAGFEFKPGFIYTQVRAISARINQNFDGWPSAELEKSYRSFLGKPCFVNHQNFDPRKARGKVVAARYVEAGDDKYVETVMEIDAQRFPKLAKEIKEGGLDSVSMGVEAGFTICSVCNNKAIDTPDFCDHVRFHKGQRFRTASGEDVLVYEKCYKLGFFELSYVFDPADETAVVSRVISAKVGGPDDSIVQLPNPDNHWGGGAGANHDTVSMPGNDSGAMRSTEQTQLFPQFEPNRMAATPSNKANYDQPAPPVGPNAVVKPKSKPAPANLPASKPSKALKPPKIPDQGSGVGMGPVAFGSIQQIEASIARLENPEMEYHEDANGDYQNPHPEYDPENVDFDNLMGDVERNTYRHLGALEDRIHHLAFGEVEAPEDVDTLRNDAEEDDGTDDFKHYVDSPKELTGPDMDQTKRLDHDQEQEGLDADRRVEDVEDVGGAPMPARTSRRRQSAPFADPRDAIDQDRPYTPGEERAVGEQYRDPAPMLIDPRTGRRYYAAEEDPSAGGPPPPPPGGDDAPAGGSESDEDLIQEAEEDLEKADEAGAGDDFSDDAGSDAGGTDDDYSDADAEGGDDQDEDDSDSGGGDLPPWLEKGDSPDDSGPPPPSDKESRRRSGNRGTSNQKKRRKGAPMSLADRQRTASGQWPRRHYADDSGHFDGGPYGEDNQGEQEEVFLSQTPGTEAVAAPVPGDGTISNTENNLVARIKARNAELRRDIIAYEQITGRRVTGYGAEYGQGPTPAVPVGAPGTPEHADPLSVAESPVSITGRRRTADDGEWPSPGEQSVSGTEKPDTVDPALSGTDQQGLSGDFDNIALDSAETQPKDASRKYFADFDRWLVKATGRSARQHNATFLRRTAARYCQANKIPVEAMFPTLGTALREARRNESTNRRGQMRKRADESLDVAAPQDRIDVEAPVSDTTDADAQASQFDLGDFGGNAGDNLADPDLSPDSQIWAPGEGDSSKTSRRKADGLTAVRYAEAYILAGLAPNTPAEKWKVAGLAQTMRHGTIVDRIRLLDAINAERAASARRTAGVNRGAGRSVPPGFGRALTAGQAQNAANDLSMDVGIWLK